MAIVPQTDEELAKQRLQVEGRPIADAGRRNQALLAMAPSGALTSGARATAGGQMATQTATAMGDVSNKIGTDIFATRENQAESERNRQQQTAMQTGQQTFQGGQADRDRDIAENLRNQALAMGGYATGENGMPTYQGQIADPKTGQLMSPEDFTAQYGPITNNDIERTAAYSNTLLNEQLTQPSPVKEAQQMTEAIQFYHAPENFNAFASKFRTSNSDIGKIQDNTTPEQQALYSKAWNNQQLTDKETMSLAMNIGENNVGGKDGYRLYLKSRGGALTLEDAKQIIQYNKDIIAPQWNNPTTSASTTA